LAEAFKDSKTAVIVDVDCTKDVSKDLCSKYGVRGYPTIKYFTGATDPMGDKYEGGRDFDSLKAFADENLGPSCSPDNIELCDDEQTAKIESYQAMTAEDREAEAKKSEDALAAAEETFKSEVETLQATYQSLMKAKDDAIAEISPGLRVLRSVINAKGSDEAAAKDEL